MYLHFLEENNFHAPATSPAPHRIKIGKFY